MRILGSIAGTGKDCLFFKTSRLVLDPKYQRVKRPGRETGPYPHLFPRAMREATPVLSYLQRMLCKKGKAVPVTGLEWPRGF
jgi:hypothetical protein